MEYHEAIEKSLNFQTKQIGVITPQAYKLIKYIDEQFDKLNKRLQL
jgi:hypothetical protein